jgi:hypothetical protein
MFSGMAGVLGGLFNDLVFTGVSFACTVSGFVRAVVVFFAVADFFAGVFAFGFAAGFFAVVFAVAFFVVAGFFVIFAICFSLKGLFCLLLSTIAYANVIYIFSQFFFSW